MFVAPWVWQLSIGLITLVILGDLIYQIRKPHEPTFKESAIQSVIYIGLALLFTFLVTEVWGARFGGEYLAGFITEKSLSVDNLFVFLVIFTKFAVPRRLQSQALLIGIVLALILRGIFIAAGTAIISRFSSAFFLFGAFLIYTAYRLLIEKEDHETTPDDSKIVKFLRAKGASTFTIALLTLGVTDLVFALDSIPAIFGITKDPYIVATANIFALMGLRQLYFLLQGLLKRLVFLSKGLSIILAFIGVKMFFEAFHGIGIHEIAGIEVPHVSIEFSLSVIIATLLITAVASLTATRKDGSEII